MPRIARVAATGYPHHITQRGNYRQRIFSGNADYVKYLSFLEKESSHYGLKILAYCLMPNHVHFIGVPGNEDSMGKAFKYTNMKYSQYFNKKMGAAGHLFQGRFFSCVMDERHTLACARYIERNPVRAKLVKHSWDWKWSSAGAHCGIDREDVLDLKSLFNLVEYPKREWKAFVSESDNMDDVDRIRKQTRRGRPIGESHFIKRLEKKLNRLLELRPRGRPKKNK